MCAPMLMAGIGLVGSVMSGIGAAGKANQQAANHEAQASIKDRQADIDIKTGHYEQERTKDTVRRTLGTQRAGFVANGIGLSGSATDVLGDTAREGALDVAAIQWNSKLRSDNSKFEARIERQNAENARDSAGMAFLAPVIGGVAKFAGSF